MFKSKVLSKKDFESLSNRANNYDKLVASIVEDNPNLKAEDVSFEMIQEMMEKDSSSEVDPELQSKFDALQSKYEGVVSEKDELQTQVNNLLSTAGEDGATISSKHEIGGKANTLVDFASENKGNTADIILEAQKDGFLPSYN